MKVCCVPVIKNKTGKVGSSYNDWPIALADFLSKVIEQILMAKINNIIISIDNQFWLKSNNSTDNDEWFLLTAQCRSDYMVGGTVVNHPMYADDLVVFSPNSAGLQ